MNIFLSYCWDDKPLRVAIDGVLKSRPEFVVAYDEAYLQAPMAVHEGLSRLLNECDCVVAVLTSNSLNSNEVIQELTRADERDKPIVSFLHKSLGRDLLPHFLRDIISIGFSENTFDRDVLELLNALTELSGKIAPRPRRPPGYAGLDLNGILVPNEVRERTRVIQRSDLGHHIKDQVISYFGVEPVDFSQADSQLTVPLLVAPDTFFPDDWTRSFLSGVLSIPADELDGKVIVEIGVGTGVAPICLHRAGIGFKFYYGFDIDAFAVRVAELNIGMHGLADRVKLAGGGSLFEPERVVGLDNRKYADLVIANVPQVPTISTGPIRDRFDYYAFPIDKAAPEDTWAKQGLWLVSEILRGSTSRLKDGGSVIVCVGGRPPKPAILSMFAKMGYGRTEPLYEGRIEQDAETDISAFAYFERASKIEYVFFDDPVQGSALTAYDAHRMLASGQPVYHEICVYRAYPDRRDK